MINLLDLRPQVSTAANPPPQNSEPDVGGFASMFDESCAENSAPEDVVAGGLAFPVAAALPVQQPRLALLGKERASATGMEGDCVVSDLSPSQAVTEAVTETADAAAITNATDDPAELSEAEPSPEKSAPQVSDRGDARLTSFPRNGSNIAEFGRDAVANRYADGLGSGNGPAQRGAHGPPPGAEDRPLAEPLSGVPRQVSQPVGPGIAPSWSGGVPEPEAMPVTVVQVHATGLPVAAAMPGPQVTIRVVAAASETLAKDPADDARMTTRLTAAEPTATANSLTSGAAHSNTGQAMPLDASEVTDPLAGEHTEHGPMEGHGTVAAMPPASAAATVTLSSAGAVTTAVIAAIPTVSAAVDHVEVILSPEELGRVQMDFRAEGDGMRVFLTAERPETLDLLRRHADQLTAELRQAGYSGASLSFGQWGQPRDDARHKLAPGAILQAESRIAAAAPAIPARTTWGHGLDLRI